MHWRVWILIAAIVLVMVVIVATRPGYSVCMNFWLAPSKLAA